MVLTADQVTVFFEGASQMDVPCSTRAQSQSKGMTDPSALAGFAEEPMAMISQNLRRPGGVQDLDPNSTSGATTPTPHFMLGAKSQTRLIAA